MNLVLKCIDKTKTLFKKIDKKMLIVVFGLVILTVVVSMSVITSISKPKVTVTYGSQSTIGVKTSEIVIKEWNVKMPVNGNILGEVSYSMKDEDTVIFSSSILNQTDLTAPECSGKTKDSWGVVRVKDNPSDNPAIVYPKVGDYYIKRIGTADDCETVKKISAAFSYMVNYMSEQ